VQENYGRAKETHAHTQTLWEKEIRRARKENFKSQSVVVKLQEELKSSRQAAKVAQSDLEQERERSVLREQEAFAARYQLVGVQEEFANLQDKVRTIEQERDALRTIAKNEEIARIAAEGQLPLPVSKEDDEFASPKKSRKSVDLAIITSSAASEEELDEARLLLQWEQHRADRALDRIEFLEAECRLNCYTSRASRRTQETSRTKSGPSNATTIPAEGFFRAYSPGPQESPWISPAKNQSHNLASDYLHQQPMYTTQELRVHSRTPSIEPPAPAMLSEERTSLLSLLDAPLSPEHADENTPPTPDRTSYGNESILDSEQPTPTQARMFKNEDSCRQIPTFHTISTTIRVPLASAPDLTPPTLDDPALSPTMSREEALAQIRERRGRARSLAQGTMTPRKQMVDGKERRDISAPAIRSGGVRGRQAARV
jgi:hypothetical protein